MRMLLDNLTRDQVSILDRLAVQEFHIPILLLMENAGRGMAEVLLRAGVAGPVVVCCGRGNNGGDGLVLARHIDAAGHPVHVILLAAPETLTGAVAQNYEMVRRAEIPLTVYPGEVDLSALQTLLSTSNWIVDGLFGTGLRGAIAAPYDRVIEAINARRGVQGTRVLALDIPSGLDADLGKPLGPTIRADITVTVSARKRGFSAAEAKEWLGEVEVVQLGIPRRLQERLQGQR